MTSPPPIPPAPHAPGVSCCASSTCRSARCSGRGAPCSWARRRRPGPARGRSSASCRDGIAARVRSTATAVGGAGDLRDDDLAAVPPLHRAGAGRVLRDGADCRRSRRQDHHLPVHPADSAGRRACSANTWPTSSARSLLVLPSVVLVVFPDRAAWRRQRSASSFPALLTDLGMLVARAGGLRRPVRAGRRAAQAPAGRRAGVRASAGSRAVLLVSGLSEAADGRLLPSGAGAARDAAGAARFASCCRSFREVPSLPTSLVALAVIVVAGAVAGGAGGRAARIRARTVSAAARRITL